MDSDNRTPCWADDYGAFAADAIGDSERAQESSDRVELLCRAQAWALLRVGDMLARLVEVLGARRARP